MQRKLSRGQRLFKDGAVPAVDTNEYQERSLYGAIGAYRGFDPNVPCAGSTYPIVSSSIFICFENKACLLLLQIELKSRVCHPTYCRALESKFHVSLSCTPTSESQPACCAKAGIETIVGPSEGKAEAVCFGGAMIGASGLAAYTVTT